MYVCMYVCLYVFLFPSQDGASLLLNLLESHLEHVQCDDMSWDNGQFCACCIRTCGVRRNRDRSCAIFHIDHLLTVDVLKVIIQLCLTSVELRGRLESVQTTLVHSSLLAYSADLRSQEYRKDLSGRLLDSLLVFNSAIINVLKRYLSISKRLEGDQVIAVGDVFQSSHLACMQRDAVSEAILLSLVSLDCIVFDSSTANRVGRSVFCLQHEPTSESETYDCPPPLQRESMSLKEPLKEPLQNTIIQNSILKPPIQKQLSKGAVDFYRSATC